MKSNENNHGLSDETVRLIQSVFTAYPAVERVVLYGSRAKGTYRTGSDIDLAIVGNGLTYRAMLDLHNALDDLELLYRFDLLNLQTASNPELIDHIQRVGVLLYQAPVTTTV
ncbi:nucleotidyltransferase domain-containing protein [Spirosoma sp. KUDC1026]|uniref:nucleotidyltransferase domain-containing protein n=1 Tax=Spirosoma sp. KUDC1026 TaxID=2745947 RepID=UPI00159B97B2|nr:nucleotidyltransferase domain-containing protein [Spirosoma sp. KUDC1026]QKZ13549.1 nucleotidyltransferase domain-containing protein [Spirosoma sp. KUDC1026]